MKPSPRDHANVLIIDTNAHFRALLVDVLRTLGVKVIYQAGDIEMSRAVMTNAMPNVILLDWLIGDPEGLELVKTIRKGAAGIRRDTPIIMVTSRVELADVESARKAGVDEYLIKPVSTANLTSRIDAVLFKRREFIESDSFVGPDRRRRVKDVDGERRNKAG